jgi:hypothetical protein
MTIKLFDGLFHRHDHFHCTAKNEKHFHRYHEKCPIPGFEFSFFSIEKHFQNTDKQYFGEEKSEIYSFTPYCNSLSYSFLLRAPPNITGNIMAS